MILRKSPSEIARMAEAGAVVAAAHDAVAAALAPDVTTHDLDLVARRVIRAHGATPSFLGYGHAADRIGFPAAICASVDDEVVHGIPTSQRRLRAGDLVAVDIGAALDGYHADAARSHVVGGAGADDERQRLVDATEAALAAGIAAMQVGGHLDDIGAAVEDVARRAGYAIVEDYVGHGIGRALHEDPSVPNTGRRGHGPRLDVGWVLAIEPLLTTGSGATRTLDDDWTVVTVDGAPAAHAEHTVALTTDGPRILTAP